MKNAGLGTGNAHDARERAVYSSLGTTMNQRNVLRATELAMRLSMGRSADINDE